jgi:hypothetical protein
MKHLKFLLLAFFLIANAQAASDDPVSEAAVKELLAVTQAEKLLDRTYENLDAMLKPALDQMLAGQPMNAAQRQIVVDMKRQMAALMNEEIGWKIMEPEMVSMYRQLFTEEEVRGMIVFYQSPAGKAVTEKMPRLVQIIGEWTQKHVLSIMPRLSELMNDTERKMRAAAGE